MENLTYILSEPYTYFVMIITSIVTLLITQTINYKYLHEKGTRLKKELEKTEENLNRSRMGLEQSYMKAIRREVANILLTPSQLLESDLEIEIYADSIAKMTNEEFDIEVKDFWSNEGNKVLVEHYSPFSAHWRGYDDHLITSLSNQERINIFNAISKNIVILERLQLKDFWIKCELNTIRMDIGINIDRLKDRITRL